MAVKHSGLTFVGGGGKVIYRTLIVVPAWATPSLSAERTSGNLGADYNFGHSVSINQNGSLAIVGVPNDDTFADGAGSAFLLENVSGDWQVLQTIFAPSDTATFPDIEFGTSVAMDDSGNTVIVGAPGQFSGGAAYVFKRADSGSWELEQELDPSHGAALVGLRVAISGDGLTSVVGAEAVAPTNIGHATVFTSVAGVWTEDDDFTGSNTNIGPISIAVNTYGTTVAFGRGGGIGSGTDIYLNTAGTWAQQGATLSEVSPGNQGSAVALSSTGDTLVVGAPDGPPGQQPSAFVYTRSSGVWSLEQTLTPPDTQNNSLYGTAVSVSDDGNVAVIGASSWNSPSANSGAAYIWERDTGVWTSNAPKLQSGDITGSDEFGTDVAMSGNGLTIIVGAPFEDEAASNAGAAYVFDVDPDWANVKELMEMYGLSASDGGRDVALNRDGSIIAIPVPDRSLSRGGVYIWRQDGDENWFEDERVDAQVGGGTSRDLGHRVLLSPDGNTLAASEFRIGSNTDRVYVWEYDGTTFENNEQILDASQSGLVTDGDTNSIAMDDDALTLVQGYTGFSGVQGEAYVWANIAGTWTEQQILSASDTEDGNLFGFSVVISGDGNVIIVGAPRTSTVASKVGQMYVFTRDPGDQTIGTAWSEVQIFTASDGAVDEAFGRYSALDSTGKRLIVSSYEATVSGNANAGKVYTFISKNGFWEEEQIIEQDTPFVDNYFGISVGISGDGDTLIVGAIDKFKSDNDPYGTGYNFGDATVYKQSAGTWASVKVLEQFGSYAYYGGYFAYNNNTKLSWDGSMAVVGAYNAYEFGGEAYGAGFNFRAPPSDWDTPTETDKVIGSEGQLLGFTTSVWNTTGSDNTAAVGMPGAIGEAGSVAIFKEQSDTWLMHSTLIPSDTTPDSGFGYSVSIAYDSPEEVVAVGRYPLVADGTPGAVYIFRRGVSTDWVQYKDVLYHPTPTADDGFGFSVALSKDGTMLAIGSLNTPTGPGSVHMYNYSGNTWSERTVLSASDETPATQNGFGKSVAVSDAGVVVVGAPDDDQVYTYTRSGVLPTYAWGSEAIHTAADTASGDLFGEKVAISGDGTIFIVGAPGDETATGAAYTFVDSGGFSEDQKLVASDLAVDDSFGRSVDISYDKTTVAVGSEGTDLAPGRPGKVYMFTGGVGSFAEVSIIEPNPSDAYQFGTEVSLTTDGAIAVIGAPNTGTVTIPDHGAGFFYNSTP